jgi:hypothetical protein
MWHSQKPRHSPESMRAVAGGQGCVAHQEAENGVKLLHGRTAFRHAFMVSFESRAVFDPSHGPALSARFHGGGERLKAAGIRVGPPL